MSNADLIEQLAAEFHSVYQAEARRQGDVRHAEDYEDLPENVKEFDRALARHVFGRLGRQRRRIIEQKARLAQQGLLIEQLAEALEIERDASEIVRPLGTTYGALSAYRAWKECSREQR